jgi:hypothetical protein
LDEIIHVMPTPIQIRHKTIMIHDHLSKELLSTFFMEFLDRFLADAVAYVARDFGFVPMDKKLVTDIALSDSNVVDLLIKVKFLGHATYFLIHVENQAQPQTDFPMRLCCTR